MRMEWIIVLVLSYAAAGDGLSSQVYNSSTSLARDGGEVHSRQKRYLIFPKGSSLQLVYCNTYLMKPVVDIFRLGMTAGLAWRLPSEPSHLKNKKTHAVFRRSVFQKLEALIQMKGGNGRQCILRALCESGQRTPSKKSFMREIAHRIFSVDSNEDDEDIPEDDVYRKAHQSVNQNCRTKYPDCSFSIFDYV